VTCSRVLPRNNTITLKKWPSLQYTQGENETNEEGWPGSRAGYQTIWWKGRGLSTSTNNWPVI